MIHSIRPVNVAGLASNVLLSEQTVRILKNCTVWATLAQEIADPRGRSEASKLSCEIVRLCAECKADVLTLAESPLKKPAADRLVRKIKTDYLKMRKNAINLGRMTDDYWGRAIPNLM